jgi:RHS repeat-associated protein
MTWDKESRMLTNSLGNVAYSYNGFDARVAKTVGGNTTTFKRAGVGPITPLLSEVVASATTRYLPAISSRSGTTSTFNHSGIKSALLQTNSSQSNTATKRYDAFGNELSTTGTWQTRFDYGGKFGYQRDSESGYMLLGHRYYDPEIGRFLTRDPSKDGRNWYTYCGNDPVSQHDESGLQQDSISNSVRQAIARGPKAIRDLLETAELTGGFPPKYIKLLESNLVRLESKASSWIAKMCKSSINQKFPAEMRNKTIWEIERLASQGNKAAKTAKKLLSDKRFRK